MNTPYFFLVWGRCQQQQKRSWSGCEGCKVEVSSLFDKKTHKETNKPKAQELSRL